MTTGVSMGRRKLGYTGEGAEMAYVIIVGEGTLTTRLGSGSLRVMGARVTAGAGGWALAATFVGCGSGVELGVVTVR